jgi:pyruvate dehydrogenase E1 component alpha subunit
MKKASSKKVQLTADDLVDKFRSRVTILGLTVDQLVEMYTTMCIIRRFEIAADKLYAMGKVHGTMHLSAGQEAVAVGTWRAVQRDDYFLNNHRGHGHFIARGSDVALMMAEFLGKDTGYCRGRGGSMHIADVETNNLGANGVVGGGITLSVGVGLALKLRHDEHIVLVVFGDGAANQGIFLESLNMAALWKLPVLFICENNHYGMSMEVSRSVAKLPIAQRAEGYGIPWEYIDGNDVLSVYETIQKAANYIRNKNGPMLVEAETYRYFGHSKSDRNLYRTREEIDAWKSKDPIYRFRTQLVTTGFLDGKQADQIDQESQAVIDSAITFAEASPEPEISTLTDFVYA